MGPAPGSGGYRRQPRRFERGYKSYRVAYGLKDPEHRAFARRPSPTGLFIATNGVVYALGVEIVMDLEIGGRTYRARGVVKNSLKVDSRMVRIMKPGMGIAFTEMGDDLKAALLAGK